MNGAELACGSIISVEPADTDYKNKSNGKSGMNDISHYGPAASAAVSSSANSNSPPGAARESGELVMNAAVDEVTKEKGGTVGSGRKEVADDDLDDFFSGL